MCAKGTKIKAMMSTSDVDRDRYMRLTLFVRVDAANVEFQVFASRETLAASRYLASVLASTLRRTKKYNQTTVEMLNT